MFDWSSLEKGATTSVETNPAPIRYKSAGINASSVIAGISGSIAASSTISINANTLFNISQTNGVISLNHLGNPGSVQGSTLYYEYLDGNLSPVGTVLTPTLGGNWADPKPSGVTRYWIEEFNQASGVVPASSYVNVPYTFILSAVPGTNYLRANVNWTPSPLLYVPSSVAPGASSAISYGPQLPCSVKLVKKSSNTTSTETIAAGMLYSTNINQDIGPFFGDEKAKMVLQIGTSHPLYLRSTPFVAPSKVNDRSFGAWSSETIPEYSTPQWISRKSTAGGIDLVVPWDRIRKWQKEEVDLIDRYAYRTAIETQSGYYSNGWITIDINGKVNMYHLDPYQNPPTDLGDAIIALAVGTADSLNIQPTPNRSWTSERLRHTGISYIGAVNQNAVYFEAYVAQDTTFWVKLWHRTLTVSYG